MIRRLTVKAFFADPDFQALVEEYKQESTNLHMPEPNLQQHLYQGMEDMGVGHGLGAYDGDKLIGFLNLLVTVAPKFGVKMATMESFFVASKHRDSGAGIKLLHEAEALAKSLGAIAMMASCPMDGRLAEVLPRVGYEEEHRVFMRMLQ